MIYGNLIYNKIKVCESFANAFRMRYSAPGLRRLRAEDPALSPCILIKIVEMKSVKNNKNKTNIYKI